MRTKRVLLSFDLNRETGFIQQSRREQWQPPAVDTEPALTARDMFGLTLNASAAGLLAWWLLVLAFSV